MIEKRTRVRQAPAIQDKSQQGSVLYYGSPLTVKRLAEVYGCGKQLMSTSLCRADFTKFEIGGVKTPMYYSWCREFEQKLDEFMSKKGFYRCIESRVPCKYTSAGRSLSST